MGLFKQTYQLFIDSLCYCNPVFIRRSVSSDEDSLRKVTNRLLFYNIGQQDKTLFLKF